LLVPWATPGNNAVRSNPTPGVRRGWKRERGTSRRWQPSPARLCSAQCTGRVTRLSLPST